MICEACTSGDHASCGMKTWCECDCDPETASLFPEIDPYAPKLLTLDEYNQLPPKEQGYACYMQAAQPRSPIPDRNPYPKDSAAAKEWSDGAFEAMLEAQEGDD